MKAHGERRDPDHGKLTQRRLMSEIGLLNTVKFHNTSLKVNAALAPPQDAHGGQVAQRHA